MNTTITIDNRIKRITSHSGHARFLATLLDTPFRIARTDIPSPYAYSPEHVVYEDEKGRFVFIVETSHKRYDVFVVPVGYPTYTSEDAQ